MNNRVWLWLKGLAKGALRRVRRRYGRDRVRRPFTALRKACLEAFLARGGTLDLHQAERPEVSVILILHDGAELTFQCISSILADRHTPLELIVVDNGSADGTAELLNRVRGATILRNESRRSYPQACAQAVEQARGEYLLFLDHDAEILGGSIASALRTMRLSPDNGAVGGKTILPDGTLEEAGAIIWWDGSRWAYGQGDDPFAPAYMFRRDVDCSSAAFLFTRRDLYEENPFADAYGSAPGAEWDAYDEQPPYQKIDYCVRLWRAGKRTVYDPDCNAIRLVPPAGGAAAARRRLARRGREILVMKHQEWLGSRLPPSKKNVLPARRSGERGRILFLDDRIPHPSFGSGQPRSNRILAEMVRLGYFVTYYPMSLHRSHEGWREIYQHVDKQVEVMKDHDQCRLPELLRARDGYYDLLFVSRPHNIGAVREALSKNPTLTRPRIVYDAEALFCFRTVEQLRISGTALPADRIRELIDREVTLAEGCDAVVSVSHREGRTFVGHGFTKVHILGHSLTLTPTPNLFDARRHLLFVGRVDSEVTPNGDAVAWFIKDVLPRLNEGQEEINFRVAGSINCQGVAALANGHVQFTGMIDDLAPVYNQARIFVAPTRFAAGIPLKVYEAAAHGLPVVATPLLAEQLGWQDGVELLVADSAESFATQCLRLYQDGDLWNLLRANALGRVQKDCSPEAFSASLKQIIEAMMG